MSLIKLRPHHFLCNLCFQGKGYNDEFVNNFSKIHENIRNHPDEKNILIVSGIDTVCKKCPEQHNGKCRKATKVSEMDNFYLRKLKFYLYDIVSLNQIIAHIKKYLSIDDFHHGCSLCSWKKMGLCEQSLSELVGENDHA